MDVGSADRRRAYIRSFEEVEISNVFQIFGEFFYKQAERVVLAAIVCEPTRMALT